MSAHDRRRSDRGATESLQWTLLVPVVMLSVLGIIQAGVLLHGRDTARQAAMAAAEAQAASGAQSGIAARVGQQVAAAGDLHDVRVSTADRGGFVTVEVTASVAVFFDIGQHQVHAVATVPKEQP